MSERPLQLMLVDEDPTFRLGLRVWLEQLPGFQVVDEASGAQAALEQLRSRIQALEQAFEQPALRSRDLRPIDLVILDMGLGQGDPDEMPGLMLCRAIKSEFPNLPVLILSAKTEPVLESAARQVGADGYGTRGMPVRDLAQLIREVAQAQPQATLPVGPPPVAAPVRPQASTQIPGPFTAMRLSMRLSGLQQINQAIAEVQTARESGRLSWLNAQVLKGRARELRAAQWIVKQLWATPQFQDNNWGTPWGIPGSIDTPPDSTDHARSSLTTAGGGRGGVITPEAPGGKPLSGIPNPALRTSQSARALSQPGDIQALIFDTVFSKLQTKLENSCSFPLEIDILRTEKKRELFYIILRKLEDLLDDLRQSHIQPGQLPEKTPKLLDDLWSTVVEEFFGKYYTVRVNAVEQEVVSVLRQEQQTVRTEILSQIPLASELLGHWLFQESLFIDGSSYLATTPEAIRHSEKLLENLIIQMANAVMQPLLNRLADVEALKKSLYNRRLMSTREIERFRNDLAWRYRWDTWVNEPKAVFESQYRLLRLTPRGLELETIYAPRRDELDQLSGIQWALTMAIETRDALAPRVRTVFSFVGSGVVYVLTEVVGRGIGLIGRGILQGVGSAWQDTKRARRRKQAEFNEWE
ncbi:MAG: DUF3685 domain-containing protein [Cyanobacteria bacterium J06635_1]